MPTNRKRTTRSRRGPPIAPDDWAFLNDDKPKNPFVALIKADSRWRALWEEYGESITSEWANRHPGTRPTHWWKFSAPRLPTPAGYEGLESWWWLEPRLQVGGEPVDATDGASARNKAVPDWDDENPAYLASPPVFESESAYLARHGLLLLGESKAAVPAKAPVRRRAQQLS
jgi:hypothetical protein